MLTLVALFCLSVASFHPAEGESLRRPYMAMYYHCAVLVDATSVIVMGGISGDNLLLPLNVIRVLRVSKACLSTLFRKPESVCVSTHSLF